MIFRLRVQRSRGSIPPKVSPMTKYQETIEGIAEQDWHTIIANLREFFPGLWDGDTEVNGADLVEFLGGSIQEQVEKTLRGASSTKRD